MVHLCANPACNRKFHVLSEGQLFIDTTPGARTPELFWMCEDCAPSWTKIQLSSRHLAPIAPLNTRILPATPLEDQAKSSDETVSCTS